MSDSQSQHDTTTTAPLLDDPEPGSTWFISLVSTVIFIAFVLAIISFYFPLTGSLLESA